MVGLESHAAWGLLSVMRHIVLKNETDWDGWRRAARALIHAGAEPQTLTWSVGGETERPAGGVWDVPRAAGAGIAGLGGDPGAGAGAVRAALQPGLAGQCGRKAAGGRQRPRPIPGSADGAGGARRCPSDADGHPVPAGGRGRWPHAICRLVRAGAFRAARPMPN